MVDGHVCRFPLTRTYMGGANYLKLSQQIINAWKTAFTIPTEKQRRCLERATQTYLCHRCYDKVACPSRYDTSWLDLSPSVGHFLRCTVESGTNVR